MNIRNIGRRIWLLSAAVAVVGMCGLADFRAATLGGKLLLVAPHLGAVAVVAWVGGRGLPWTAVAALGGSSLMAFFSWYDLLTRQTDGFEWRFNNSLGGEICCGANWFVPWAVCMAAIAAVAWNAEPPDRTEGESGDPGTCSRE